MREHSGTRKLILPDEPDLILATGVAEDEKKSKSRFQRHHDREKKFGFEGYSRRLLKKKSSQKKISCNWLGQQKLDKKGSIRWKKRINRRQRRRRRRRVSDTVRQDLSVTASKTKRLRNT